MWDKDSQRAARQAYKDNRRAARQAYRDARYQYRTSRRPMNNRGRIGGAIFIVLLIIYFSMGHFHAHSAGFFWGILPIIIIAFFFLRAIMGNRRYQQPYQPYNQSTQQPYQTPQSPETPYYQSPQPSSQPEAYQDYNQGYQTPASEPEQERNSPAPYQEPYSQDEQPQALYPQSLPPMEQQ